MIKWDLLAVAYVTYYYRGSRIRSNGARVEHKNPDRRHHHNISVSADKFSQKNPQLLMSQA